jgi:hypothetical protein
MTFVLRMLDIAASFFGGTRRLEHPRAEGTRPSGSIQASKAPMGHRRFPVFLDTRLGRIRAGFSAAPSEKPAVVALKLRNRGWIAYKIRWDAEDEAWIAAIARRVTPSPSDFVDYQAPQRPRVRYIVDLIGR